MKKINLLLIVLFCCGGVFAQHKIEVKRLRQWGHEYFTVTNNWNGIFVSPIKGEVPPVLAVITEINGEMTKDMSLEQFYLVLDNSLEVSFTYLLKKSGENLIKTVVLEPRKDYYLSDLKIVAPFAKPNTINIASDADIDYFNYNTFDYKVEGDDPLTDKSILDELSEVFEGRGMKRDTENPDLILTLSKSLQQSTNSVYVPKTQQVVSTGSTTSLQRNIFTGKNYVATQQHNTVISSGDYTHTGVNATFKLQLSVIDNKKNNDNMANVLPVVWKLDYNVFSSNAIDIMEETKNGVSYWCMNYPFSEPMFSYSIQTTGVVFQDYKSIKTGKIVDVLSGTDAYAKGLRKGDQIIRAYWKGFTMFVISSSSHSYFRANSDRTRFWGTCWMYCIPIFPINSKNRPYDYLTYYSDFWGNRAYFKVLHPDGSTSKMKAPFSISTFDYEYIPTL